MSTRKLTLGSLYGAATAEGLPPRPKGGRSKKRRRQNSGRIFRHSTSAAVRPAVPPAFDVKSAVILCIGRQSPSRQRINETSADYIISAATDPRANIIGGATTVAPRTSRHLAAVKRSRVNLRERIAISKVEGMRRGEAVALVDPWAGSSRLWDGTGARSISGSIRC